MRYLGYSAGCYLALMLMLADPCGRFANTRAALFASGAPLGGIRAESLFIMDDSAAERLPAYLRGGSFPHGVTDGRQRQLVDAPTRWLKEVLFHGDALAVRMKDLQDRLLVVVNSADRVILAEQAAWNLHPALVLHLDLGVHEFLYTTGVPLPDRYDRRAQETRAMIRNVRHVHRIGP